MGHFVFVVPPFVGHLNPMSVLARTMARRGHRITIVSHHDSEPFLERGEFEVCIYGKDRFLPGEWNRRMSEIGQLTGKAATIRSIALLCDHTRCTLEELPTLFSQLRPDGVVMDQVSFGVESVAAVLKIPLAVVCNALPLHRERSIPPCNVSWRYEVGWRASLRNMVANITSTLPGLAIIWEVFRFRRRAWLPLLTPSAFNEVPPSLAQVAQVPAFLDFPRRALPDHFHYTGPWHELTSIANDRPFPWEKLDSRPLIYASLGTLQNRVDEIYGTIASACASLPVQVVLALGRTAGRLANSVPANTLVVEYAPQLQLLKRAALVITHAGMNTALETLRQGVPMVAIPITNDQPGVAARLERLGVAEVVQLDALSIPRLTETIQRVRSERSYGERCAWAARELKRIHGPDAAADIIERALMTRQRVTRSVD